jgi:UbiA prenyltransferase family
MNWRTALELGRVSNLPTVWTNVLAGLALVGAGLSLHTPSPFAVVFLFISMSLYYIGGMYLNDAFDAKRDAGERPGRPIPSGRVTARQVFIIAFALIGAGLATLLAASLVAGKSGQELVFSVAAGLALTGAIVFYDWRHKGRWYSPAVMGMCRALIYVSVAFALGIGFSQDILFFSLLLLLYVAGLTVIASREAGSESTPTWPWILVFSPTIPFLETAMKGVLGTILLALFYSICLYAMYQAKRSSGRSVKKAVMALIAGIAVFDALLCNLFHCPVIAVIAVGGFALTLLFQRRISGT